MMKAVILVLALCGLALAAVRPVVPETYRARINFSFYNGTREFADGDGDEARDAANNRAVLHAEYFDVRPPLYIYNLARFDLNHEYFLDNHNWTVCHNRTLTGNLPPAWSWLANATYDGTRPYRGAQIDFWNTTISYPPNVVVRLAAGFRNEGNTTAPSVPTFRFEEIITPGYTERRTIDYFGFNTTVEPDWFVVPKQCGGTMSKYFLW